MSKAIIIYGSTTGNTKEMANAVEKGVAGAGQEVVLKNVADAQPEELTGYDFILLGSSTWGDGELQDDFICFEEEMQQVDLNGKKAAVFGCGEISWPLFCEAVNILEYRLKECGADLVIEGYKVDGDVMPELDNLADWGTKAVALINAKKSNNLQKEGSK